MTLGPSRPRPGDSSTRHGAPPPSPTPPPPPSWRSAPRPKHDAPRPAASESPHPRPTDRPRPDQIDARVHQHRLRPPTNPGCQPTYSTCPATAATGSPNPTPRRRLCEHTRESTSARAPTPRALPWHRTTRNPPGPPPPPVPTTPSHPPTPTPPPKTAAPPRDSGGGTGPTRSSGSCESGPGQSPPSRAWSTGPARGLWRTAASSRRGGGCRRPHGKPCWPMRSTPWESTPATSPHPRTTRMSSGACGRPSRRRSETASACGTSPKAQPRTHTHPRHPTSVGAPHAGGTHSTPGALRATQHDAPDAPASGAATYPLSQPAIAAGRHTRPRPEDTKQTGSQRTPTHTPTGTATPKHPEPKPATVTTA